MLPEVLDEVHRITTIATLAKVGIEVALGTWEEIDRLCKQEESRLDPYIVSSVCYSGAYPIGPILGSNHFVVESGTTYNSTQQNSRPSCRYNRAIYLHNRPTGNYSPCDMTRILLAPDIPPVAIHKEDIEYVAKQDNLLLKNEFDDIFMLKSVQRAFGDDTVEFISENTAKDIMDLLLQEQTTSAIA
jgi:hypothetical protein